VKNGLKMGRDNGKYIEWRNLIQNGVICRKKFADNLDPLDPVA
jgi:hypothetical protein